MGLEAAFQLEECFLCLWAEHLALLLKGFAGSSSVHTSWNEVGELICPVCAPLPETTIEKAKRRNIIEIKHFKMFVHERFQSSSCISHL